VATHFEIDFAGLAILADSVENRSKETQGYYRNRDNIATGILSDLANISLTEGASSERLYVIASRLKHCEAIAGQ